MESAPEFRHQARRHQIQHQAPQHRYQAKPVAAPQAGQQRGPPVPVDAATSRATGPFVRGWTWGRRRPQSDSRRSPQNPHQEIAPADCRPPFPPYQGPRSTAPVPLQESVPWSTGHPTRFCWKQAWPPGPRARTAAGLRVRPVELGPPSGPPFPRPAPPGLWPARQRPLGKAGRRQ